MPKKKLVIFPFNGNGMEALDCLDLDRYEFIGFVDDDASKRSEEYEVHSREILTRYNDLFVLAVPGSPTTYSRRAEFISSLNMPPDKFISAIHPAARIGKNVRIGYNTLIMAGVVLTSNAVVGNHVCILPNSVVHHDAVVHDYSLIGSNVVIAGGTVIGTNCYIGSGSNIINGIQVADFALVGLGTNVISSVPPAAKMIGNPARNLNKAKDDHTA
jgi:sugar O-acyltransferase (sialic acid O-acetyltransferase NeuD family)